MKNRKPSQILIVAIRCFAITVQTVQVTGALIFLMKLKEKILNSLQN